MDFYVLTNHSPGEETPAGLVVRQGWRIEFEIQAESGKKAKREVRDRIGDHGWKVIRAEDWTVRDSLVLYSDQFEGFIYQTGEYDWDAFKFFVNWNLDELVEWVKLHNEAWAWPDLMDKAKRAIEYSKKMIHFI